MIKFSEWAEQFGVVPGNAPGAPMPQAGQAPAQGNPGVAEPQHTSGEDEMDVSQVIERRLQMLVDELEKKKRLPRTQLVQILSQVVQTLGGMGLNKTVANQVVKGQFSPAPAPGTSASPSMQPQITA